MVASRRQSIPAGAFAPHRFTLRQLQYAVAVADALSFRRAAERCRVAQPSLSSQIAELESALGAKLFERDKKRVLITAQGHALLGRMRELIRSADDLALFSKEAADPLRGILRIGVLPTISPYLLPAVAPELKKAFDRLTVAWVEDKTDVLARMLSEGELDAAIVALEAELGDVDHAVLADDPFVLAAPIGSPLAKKTTARVEELAGASLLLLDDGHCLRAQAQSFCEDVRPNEIDLRATSLGTLAQMVAAGVGVTLLPTLSLATESRRARFATRKFVAPAPSRTIVLVWRKRSPLAPAFSKLAAVVRSAYPTGP